MIKKFKEFISESKKYTVDDFLVGTKIEFKDKEVWVVVKPNARKASDEITIKPYNDIAKKHNVSVAIDYDIVSLNKDIKSIIK